MSALRPYPILITVDVVALSPPLCSSNSEVGIASLTHSAWSDRTPRLRSASSPFRLPKTSLNNAASGDRHPLSSDTPQRRWKPFGS